MFRTTNRHQNSRLIVQKGRYVMPRDLPYVTLRYFLQVIQHPNLPQVLALSICVLCLEFSKPLMFPQRAPTA